MPQKQQAILLLHGMGTHTGPKDGNPGSFHKEFTDATTKALQKYSSHQNDTVAKHLDIYEYNYDDWLNQMRQTMADNAKSMQERINTIAGIAGVPVPIDLVSKLVGFEADFGKDEFFYTHWLDVILYGSLFGEKIRVGAAQEVAKLVAKYGAGNVHIVAHSLGTAVIHDALHKLYRAEHDPTDSIQDLDPVDHSLGSIWMISNVSGLVNSVSHIADPLQSTVKPGSDGCCNQFFNVRHEMDPFTWLAQFDPKNDSSWLREEIYAAKYKSIVTNLVVDPNTHSFPQYLEDPKFAEHFLYQMIPTFDPKISELDKVSDAYQKSTIQGAYASLEDTMRNLDIKKVDSWRDFLDAAKTFKEAIERVTDSI